MAMLLLMTMTLCDGFVALRNNASPITARLATKDLEVDLSGKVTVFSTRGCPYCNRAKSDLRELNVPYSVVDVQDSREALAALSGKTSVPQIYVDGERLGGADDLRAAIADGSFSEMISGLDLKAEEDESYLVPEGRALNDLNQLDLAATLQERALDLVDAHVSESGVDYAGMKKSQTFGDFVSAAGALRQLSRLDDLDDAFYINLYNAMVLHANAVLGPPGDKEERQIFFSQDAKYVVGPIELTLDEIEHGILRRSKDPWRALDDKKAKIVGLDSKPPFDNRIHFALNCGAKSCPPIKIFRSESLDHDLALAAQAFIEAETRVDPDAVRLSKLLDWYGDDFGDDLIASLVSLLPPGSKLAEELRDARDRRIVFNEYDWTTY